MDNKNKILIAIAGGSGSGKTTAAKKLQNLIGKDKCFILSQDNYYKDQSANFKGDGSINFDHPNALDFELMSHHLSLLKKGMPVDIPLYDFVTHTRKKETLFFTPPAIIIIDGTLILTQENLRSFFDNSLFLDINEELRLSRRLKRDVDERGRTPEGVIKQFTTFVKPMHDQFVQPSKIFAKNFARNDVEVDFVIHEIFNQIG